MDGGTLARRQHGVLTLDQAVTAGLTPSAVRWRVASGRWQSLGRGLFLVHTAEPDWYARAAAAVLRAGRGAVLTGTSAAYLHRLQDRPPTRVTVAIPPERRAVPLHWMTVQRRAGLPSVTRASLPVLPAAWTALDLGDRPTADWRDAVAACARAVQKRRCSTDQLREALDSWTRHRHGRALGVALAAIGDGAESVLEVAYLSRVQRRHTLPEVRIQVPEHTEHGSVRRDFRYEGYGVDVEVDGRLGHVGDGMWRDRRRDRAAARRGVVTLRAGTVDVEMAPCELAADVLGALMARGYQGPRRPCGPRCAVEQLVSGEKTS
jgi:hypothetical protein